MSTLEDREREAKRKRDGESDELVLVELVDELVLYAVIRSWSQIDMGQKSCSKKHSKLTGLR